MLPRIGLPIGVRRFILPGMPRDLQVTVVFEEDEDGGYTVVSPSVPGCVSYGKTIEEGKRNFQKALKLHLACLKAHSKAKRLPEPKNIFTAVLHLSAA